MRERRRHLGAFFCVLPLVFLASACAPARGPGGRGPEQLRSIPERLGYPPDSKLLIIHADDLGVAHSVDRASFAALDAKAVSSASVMVPCAWLTEVAGYAKQHPGVDLGLHLTLTSEWETYRWGPVASNDRVPSLLDPGGYFWPDARSAASHARPEEAAREIRAQIERARRGGIRPTHLDSHMGTLFESPALFAVYVKLAREYDLPFLAVRIPNAPPELLAMLKETDVVLDALVSAHEGVRPEQWKSYYADLVRTLKPGLTEMIVHLGYDDSELEAIAGGHPNYGAAWRQRDYYVVTSPEFQSLLKDNHVILIGWKDLMKLVGR